MSIVVMRAGLGSTLTEEGKALRDADPTGTRVFSGISVGASALVGYGAYRLFKSSHPVWGTLVGLLAIGGLANNTVGLITGKQWLG